MGFVRHGTVAAVTGFLMMGAVLRPLAAQRSEAARGDVGHVPAGTRFTARLDGPIDAASTRVGDRFSARVTGPTGRGLVPMGAIVTGTVAGIQRTHGTLAPAFVRLTIESLTLDGRVQPMRAVIESADLRTGSPQPGDAPLRSHSLPEAARGTVLVGIRAGDAMEGSLISLGTNDASLRLPSGTVFTLRAN